MCTRIDLTHMKMGIWNRFTGFYEPNDNITDILTQSRICIRGLNTTDYWYFPKT